ncbi:helix-turn-helix transcriptional regulator [Phaeobacter sp. PT47_59]|uniref:helix-turn-helix domain-containing protein n=1 Tax=Phaeobacter sp. PT47_59 TaxID=3029979 RepID=UPI002380C2EB|nr:helix-turn-helix transcriptional regulator [Phaeobacter sp. PT47_59]MDE4175408.1 helix-turn-helix transcriptional regulator [Phaeobacter sp. PT47_59]
MTIRYEDIGQRLRAFRLGSGLSAEEIASRIGVSRTAVYRLEKGEVVKIETLLSLAQLFGVSLPTLLGVEMEYISSAVTYFERLRQLEAQAERIVTLAGPISFLLSSPSFKASLGELLRESISSEDPKRDEMLRNVERILEILDERKATYEAKGPAVVALISALDVERLLRAGFVGRPFLTASDIEARQRRARTEIEHFAQMAENSPMGVQIGLVTGTLPHSGFQLIRSGERKTLAITPFRLGEQPNIRRGVAMITSSDDAVAMHESIVDELWQGALKGREAASYLRLQMSNNPDLASLG